MSRRIKGLLAVALLLAVLLSMLSSCVQKPQAEVTTEWEGKEEIESSNGEMDKATAALAARYEEFELWAPLAFSQSSVSPESDFKFDVTDGKATVTEYVGSSDAVVIPETMGGVAVVSIAKNAFSGKNVRSVLVPDSVKAIEKSAFAGIKNLASMRLPFVGDGDKNTYFGYIFGADTYDKNATKVPASLEVLVFGDGAEEISDNAFAGCKTLSCVILPDSVKRIGNFAFYECYDLVYVNLGRVKSIGDYAFGYCSSLFKMVIDVEESVGLGALYECSSLRYLGVGVIGKNSTENRYIGHIFGAESADYNDEFVPKSLYNVAIINCKDIPDRAFAGCSDIGEIVIADAEKLGEEFTIDTENIGARAFYGCRSLKKFSLPDSVKIVGDDAFFGCDNLEKVEFGAGIVSIGMQAFYGCRRLKNVELPDEVTEIKPSTFALCSSLETVDLNNVKKVGKDAFWSCKALKAVDCAGIEVDEGNTDLTTD